MNEFSADLIRRSGYSRSGFADDYVEAFSSDTGLEDGSADIVTCSQSLVLHGRDQGDAERIVGMALSLGPATTLLADGVSEEELGLTALREVAGRVIGGRAVPLWLGYRVRLGVK